MGRHIFAVCFVLVSFVTEGSCSQTTFIQTDHDLILHVPESQRNIDTFYWKFNTNKKIITLIGGQTFLSLKYKDRVEFFAQNLSLILKDVTLNDSGVYTAVVGSDDVEDETLATFDVTVEAPMSAVCLRLDSVSNSSDSCNFTAICKTELFNISRSFTCDTHHCEEPLPKHAGHTLSSPSLDLSLVNASIICNHSNHISSTNVALDYRQECEKHGEKVYAAGNSLRVGVGIGVVLFVVVIAIVFIFMRKGQKQRRGNTEYTLHYVLKDLPAHTDTYITLEEAASSMYSLVGPQTALVHNPTPSPVQNLTPFPVQDPTPSPVQDPTPSPVQDPTPAPVQDPTPAPVKPPLTKSS